MPLIPEHERSESYWSAMYRAEKAHSANLLKLIEGMEKKLDILCEALDDSSPEKPVEPPIFKQMKDDVGYPDE